MNNNEIINEARSWIGTKWIHGQALKGVGTDCVHFLIAIAKTFNWIPQNYKPPVYNQDWALHNEESILLKELEKFCYKIESPFQVGDVLTFIFGKCVSHAGIYIGDNKMVHAYIRRGVVESSIEHYKKYFHSAWRIKNA